MNVYSSFPNVKNFKRSCMSMPQVYKRYALMYDQVIFNRHGCPIGKGDLFSSLSEYVSTLASNDKGERALLGKNKRFQELFIDLWDVVEDPEKTDKEAREYVSEFDQEQLSSFSWGRNLIDQEMGIENHYKEYKAAAIVIGDLVSDLSYNFYLKNRIPEFCESFAPVIGEALNSSIKCNDVNELFTTTLVIPNFEELSWDHILDLREDKYIKEFRKKVFSCSNGEGPIDEIIKADLDAALWDLASQCKPNMLKTLVEVVLSNIPSPTMVNPFGLYYGARDTVETYQNKKDKSWIYFVQSLKKSNQQTR